MVYDSTETDQGAIQLIHVPAGNEIKVEFLNADETIFCSQYVFNEWYNQLGEEASFLADAIIDRIVHDSYQINITSIDAEHDRGAWLG